MCRWSAAARLRQQSQAQQNTEAGQLALGRQNYAAAAECFTQAATEGAGVLEQWQLDSLANFHQQAAAGLAQQAGDAATAARRAAAAERRRKAREEAASRQLFRQRRLAAAEAATKIGAKWGQMTTCNLMKRATLLIFPNISSGNHYAQNFEGWAGTKLQVHC